MARTLYTWEGNSHTLTQELEEARENTMKSSSDNTRGISPEQSGHAKGFAALDSVNFPDFAPGCVWLVGAGQPSAKQQDISVRLVELAREGKRVLRLKGGDPLMFGRGGEECQLLARTGIPFRIVPGITAGAGALAYAGIPTTHRDTNQSVLFLTGHDASGDMPSGVDWENVTSASPVIVMYMAVRNLPKIAKTMLGFGRSADEPVAVISNASLREQSVHTTTLGKVSDNPDITKLPTPALVVVGKVVDFHRDLDWYVKALRENPLG
jgi:uroporphyrin-III C-methyltransferase